MALDLEMGRAELEQMDLARLRARYLKLFGETTYTRYKSRLVRQILWRLQALEEGDLSERARRRAIELADDAHLRLTAPGPKRARRARVAPAPRRRLPSTGVVLTRRYKGKPLEVTVLDDGFAYEGKVFRTLSAVAKHITGSHWNGRLFFGLAKNGDRA